MSDQILATTLAFDAILDIILDERHYITSATMLKYLASRSNAELDRLAAALPPGKREVLCRNVRNYYRNHAVPSPLAFLQ